MIEMNFFRVDSMTSSNLATAFQMMTLKTAEILLQIFFDSAFISGLLIQGYSTCDCGQLSNNKLAKVV